MNKIGIKKALFCFTLFVFLFSYQVAESQVGQQLSVSGEFVSPGDIVVSDRLSGRFQLSNQPSSPNIFGIVVERPVMGFRSDTDEGGFMVVRTGQVLVNVSLLNGPIKSGDPLTTSLVSGHAMLASEEHRYLVGVALENFDGTGENVSEIIVPDRGQAVLTGKIRVDLQIGSRSIEEQTGEDPENLDEGVLSSFINNYIENPWVTVVRYLLATLVALGSIYLSYRFFQLNVGGGLSALARNPLAKSPIQKMIILHITIMIFISLAGLSLSVFILVLPIIYL